MSRAKSAVKKFTFALALTGAVLALGSATGREQPEETLLRIGPAAAEPQGVKGGRARDQEEERHVPAVEEHDENREPEAWLRVFHVEPVEVKNPGAVEINQQSNRHNSQPIQVMPSLSHVPSLMSPPGTVGTKKGKGV